MVVAGGVFAVLDEECAVLHLLGRAALQVTLALLRDNIGDEAALRLEVVLHGLGLVCAALVGEHGVAAPRPEAVNTPLGEDRGAVHIHLDIVGIEFQVSVFHRRAAVHERVVPPRHHERVRGMKLHNVLNVNLPAVNCCHRLAFEQRVLVDVLIGLAACLRYAVSRRCRLGCRQFNGDSV